MTRISSNIISSLLFVWALSPGLLPAQSPTTGLLSGTVRDPSGAVVGSVKITLTSSTGEQRAAVSEADGSYRFALAPPGSYDVAFEAAGFQVLRETGVIVRVTETTDISPILAIAGTTASVSVTGQAPLLQASEATTGRVIDTSQVNQLPLPTRNFQQLLTLSPGTASSLSNNTELGRGDANIYVDGQRDTSNNVVLDGTEIDSPGTNSTPNISVPAPDAIQEFIVQTSLYDATQGRNAGGNIAVVTKTGTNAVHGSAWEFFRNRELNANDFFLNTAGDPRPVLSRNQFGGDLGGPIIKDKTFFFVEYQGTRERNGASLSSSLSDANIPAGLTNDRSLSALQNLNASFYTPGKAAPALNPIAVKLLQARLPDGSYAIPSAAGAAASLSFPVTTPLSGISTFSEDQWIGNLDQQIGSKNRLSAKFFGSDDPQYQSTFSFLGANPNQVPGYGGYLTFRNREAGVTDDHIFSSTLLNEAHFGFSRINGPSHPQEPFQNSTFGINNPLCSVNGQFCGLSTIEVLGLFSIGSAPLGDQHSTVNTFEWTDTLSWTLGKHLVRIGADTERYQVNFLFNFFSRGEIAFSSFQDFLAGNLNGASGFGLLGNGIRGRDYRATDVATYVQDDWKLSPSLTLNLGIRVQFSGGISDTQGRLVSFNPAAFPGLQNPCTALSPCLPPNGFEILNPGQPLNPSRWNAAPRFGFAWNPQSKKSVVVRGGYGIYYDRFSTRLANLQVFNYPFDIVGIGLGSFANPFPNLAKVNFPVTPAVVPSPVPYYFAGFPLPGLRTPISGFYVDPNLHVPYVQQYNFGVQWELRRNWMLDVGYMGSKGTDLLNTYTLNQGVTAATAPYSASGFSNNKALNGFQMAKSDANSEYNSLQSSLTKRFSNGLQFLASYTWSKSIDDTSGSPTNEFGALPGNQQNRSSNRGPSDFDRPQRFVFSGTYDLPKFHGGTSAFTSRLLNGWELGGIFTVQSGTPFSVVCEAGSSLYNRADTVAGVSPYGSGSVESRLNNYFNSAAFSPTCVNVPPFGTSGRNILRGPGQRNVDLSVVKFIPLAEPVKLEIRGELFNAFNFVNFANPNANVLVPGTLGRITQSSAGPRVIQFAAKLSF